MAYKQPIRNRTEGQNPTHAMGMNVFSWVTQFKLAISKKINTGRPCPAGTRLVNLVPKPFHKQSLYYLTKTVN